MNDCPECGKPNARGFCKWCKWSAKADRKKFETVEPQEKIGWKFIRCTGTDEYAHRPGEKFACNTVARIPANQPTTGDWLCQQHKANPERFIENAKA